MPESLWLIPGFTVSKSPHTGHIGDPDSQTVTVKVKMSKPYDHWLFLFYHTSQILLVLTTFWCINYKSHLAIGLKIKLWDFKVCCIFPGNTLHSLDLSLTCSSVITWSNRFVNYIFLKYRELPAPQNTPCAPNHTLRVTTILTSITRN